LEIPKRVELLVELFLVVVISTERINRTNLSPSVAELLCCVTHETADITACEVYPEDLENKKCIEKGKNKIAYAFFPNLLGIPLFPVLHGN